MKQLIKILVIFNVIMVFIIWNIGRESSTIDHTILDENISMEKAKELALDKNSKIFSPTYIGSFDHILEKEITYKKSWIPFVYKGVSVKITRSYLKKNLCN